MTKKERLQARLEAIETKVSEAFAKWLDTVDESTKNQYEALSAQRDTLEEQISEEEAKEARKNGSNLGEELAKNENKKPGKYSEDTLNWLKDFREAVSAGGRFSGTLPTEIADYIISKMQSLGGIRNYVRTIRVGGDYAVLVDAGGVEVVEVGSTYAETDQKFGALQLAGITFGGICKIDRNMVMDYAVDLIAYIGDQFAKAFLAKEEKEVFAGTGKGETRTHVRGIVTNLVPENTVTTAGGHTADFTWEEAKSVIHKLKGDDRKAATVFMSQDALDFLHGIKDKKDNYIFDQSKPVEKILGVPVVATDCLDNLGAGHICMVAGNFSKYVLAERNGMELSVMEESYLKQGKVGVWGSQRFDGEGVWDSFSALKLASV